ncbi:MAG: nickel-dependent lactate racemase [Fimbriimonadales bacterium]|nr:nickel-dependent lactate racemase [Fimbriimonadales bacterium]
MPIKTFVRYGKQRLPILVPDHAAVLRSKSVIALQDPMQAVSSALKSPIGSPPLLDLLNSRRPKTAVITISDITRPVPNEQMLPPILDELHAFGLTKEDITILVATGMHRSSTDEEKVELVGKQIAESYRIVDHKSEDRDELAKLPRLTVKGTEAYVNKLYIESDFKIVTGFIEPHFMAGFSGGRKGVCPGLVNVDTVRKFHGFEFLDSPKTTNFSIEGNPLHEEAIDVASMAGIDFLVNVALNEDKQMAAVFAGNWIDAWMKGIEVVKDWTGVWTDRQYDVVVASGGGYPLDKTLYQTGKGMCSALPIVKEGGVVICASECSEGLGSESFANIMTTWGNDWRGYIDFLRSSSETIHDQWGFQMHTKVLQRVGGPERLRFLCSGIPEERLRSMAVSPIERAGSAEEALQAEIDRHWHRSIAVIPDGPYTVAQFGGQPVG